MHLSGFLATAATAWLANFASAHMEMSKPYAIRSKFDPANKSGGNIDYSMTAPLEASGANYPCKGYHTDPDLHIVANYKAGSTYNMEVAGSAVHNGGSCQLSLSYDGGKTFRVIKSMIGGCPLTKSYDFTIPAFAPNGTALLGWTWQNHSGNREFYMNCAVVDIESGAGAPSSKARREAAKSRRGAAGSFDQLPFIWKANMPQVGPCTTKEGSDPVYPHPGSDVVYGSGKSSADAPDPQEGCDSSSSDTSKSGNLHISGPGEDAGVSQSSSVASQVPTLSPLPVASSLPTGPFASTTVIHAVSDPTQRPAASSSNTATPLDANPAVPTSSVAPSSGQNSGSTSSPAAGGSCNSPGVFQCTQGGRGFAVCDHGKWVDMGAVAAGTVCQQGQIVAATSTEPSNI